MPCVIPAPLERSPTSLLVQDARAVHRQLKASGFVEYGDPAPHHLCPLRWPSLPVFLEVHSAPNWPKQLTPPSAAELIGAALPSALGVDGVLAPDPARHALLIAAHSWAHEPLRRLRDLVDARAVAAEADPAEVRRLTRSWHVDRLWRTTEAVAQTVFEGRPSPLVLRLRARHLAAVREPTVLEHHLRRWLAGYGALPPRIAAADAFAVLRADLRPAPEESWRAKLMRTTRAFRDARMPLSHHDLLLGEEATRGRGRNPRDDVEEEPLS